MNQYSFLFEDVDWTAEDTAELKRRRAEEAKKPGGGKSMNEIRDEIYREKVAREAQEKSARDERARQEYQNNGGYNNGYEFYTFRRGGDEYKKMIKNIRTAGIGLAAINSGLALLYTRSSILLKNLIKDIMRSNNSEEIADLLTKYYSKIKIFTSKIDFKEKLRKNERVKSLGLDVHAMFKHSLDLLIRYKNNKDFGIAKQLVLKDIRRLRNSFIMAAISLGASAGFSGLAAYSAHKELRS